MYAALFRYHAEAHIEAMKENTGDPEGDLGQVQRNTSLVDKIYTLGPAQSFLRRRDTLYNRGCALDFI